MIRRALFCTLSKAMQRYCGKFAKTTDAYSRTDLSREQYTATTCILNAENVEKVYSWPFKQMS